MNKQHAAELLTENLGAIYGYAYARLYDKERAEDLASEILCEILSSADRLENDAAFWGFAWRIAENTFRKFIRREKMRARTAELNSDTPVGVFAPSPEEDFVERESTDEALYRLRRELSLLSRLHRDICVAYYVRGRSCAQIAAEQGISAEMVKYHLFNIRKHLKEGIGMNRKLGEKSYNPGTFRLNFWGDWNRYDSLCERRLPGSILLAAYDTPLTAEELSLELGVAMPYLEEELETLETAGVLRREGKRYQTNLIILTDRYEKDFARRAEPLCAGMADGIFADAAALLPRIRRLDFAGREYDDNRLLFSVLNIAMMRGYALAKEKAPTGPMPPLPLGSRGWLYGHDNDYINNRFCGITMETWNREQTAWFCAVNYRVLRACQLYSHRRFQDRAEIMCAAALGGQVNEPDEITAQLAEEGFIRCEDGRLCANFPVFTRESYDALCTLLRPLAEKTAELMLALSALGREMLASRVPTSVREQCGDIAKIHHRLDAAAILMENWIASGRLTVPAEKTPLCVFGVKK